MLLAVVAGFGVLGGPAHKLTAAADDKTGWAGYTVVGGVAALAVLLVFDPKDAARLVAVSVVAGYGGKAILDALEGKVRTAIAEAKVSQAQDAAQQAISAGRKAAEQARELTSGTRQLDLVLAGGKTKGTQPPLTHLAVETMFGDATRRDEVLARIDSDIDKAEGALAATWRPGVVA